MHFILIKALWSSYLLISDDFGPFVQIFWPEFDKGQRVQCAPLSVTFIVDTNKGGEPATQFWPESDGDMGVHCALAVWPIFGDFYCQYK